MILYAVLKVRVHVCRVDRRDLHLGHVSVARITCSLGIKCQGTPSHLAPICCRVRYSDRARILILSLTISKQEAKAKCCPNGPTVIHHPSSVPKPSTARRADASPQPHIPPAPPTPLAAASPTRQHSHPRSTNPPSRDRRWVICSRNSAPRRPRCSRPDRGGKATR